MKYLNLLILAAIAAFSMVAVVARADEGDTNRPAVVAVNAPAGVIVRESADGSTREFYSSNTVVANAEALPAAVVDANRLNPATVGDEGDVDASRQAWWWCTPTWGYGYSWLNYSYPIYRTNFWYQPIITNYWYGGWNYFWYARLF